MKNEPLSHTHLQRITSYNLWANRKIVGFLSDLSPALLDKELISSFKSIRATVYHIWDAENIWLSRLNGTSFTSWPSKDFKGSDKEAFDAFMKQSEDLAEYTAKLSEEELGVQFSYKTLDGKQFTNSRSDVIAHVVNHSTFHRGQLITMLRNAGFTQLSSTDFITFARGL
jgi:uncharacterized damage-inducible protein DinB